MASSEFPTTCQTTPPTTRDSELQQTDSQKTTKTSRRRKRKATRFIPRIGCLRLEQDSDTPYGGFSLEMECESNGNQSAPTHLVVMVNGLIGSATDWRFSAQQFLKRYPKDVIVHCSQRNSAMLTFDGVDTMGERLAEEVISVIKSRSELQKISFVGHSMGGLVARYAIGRLYGKNIKKEHSTRNGNCGAEGLDKQCVDEKSESQIAGLEPINFITIATPHLGSRGRKQVPGFGTLLVLEKALHHTSWLFGRTGKQLMLVDKDEGKLPLLLQMVNDCGDLRFMSALRSFRRRVTYANSCFDFLVGWRTSSIRRQNELPKHRHLLKNDRYPHIVNVEAPKFDGSDREVSLEAELKGLKTSDMEEFMIRGLTKVSWERVDVSFRRSKQAIFAHSTIQNLLITTPSTQQPASHHFTISDCVWLCSIFSTWLQFNRPGQLLFQQRRFSGTCEISFPGQSLVLTPISRTRQPGMCIVVLFLFVSGI